MEQHYGADYYSGAQIGCLKEEGLERSNDRHLRFECSNKYDIRLDRQRLIYDFLSSNVGISLTDVFDLLLLLIVVRQSTRTFWVREGKGPEQGRWPRIQAHHVSPAMKLALLAALRVLPRVFNNEGRPRLIPFTMCSPTSCDSTGNTRHAFYDLVKDQALCAVVSFDLDVPLVPGCDDSLVESKLFLVQPWEPEHGGNELQPLFIDVERRRGDPPKSVKVLQPHARSTQCKAEYEASTVLSGEDLTGLSSEVKPCFRSHISQWVALEFFQYENLLPVVCRVRAGAGVIQKADI